MSSSLSDNKWSLVKVTGAVPSPRISFSFNLVDEHRAVLFGGYNENSGYLNDVYILDLDKMVSMLVSVLNGGMN